MLRHRSPEWYAARRSLITATDIPVILGLSPYRSESTLAQEKLGQIPDEPETLVMQIGRLIEPAIAAEYSRLNDGVRLTRFSGLVVSKSIKWAAASPDYRRSRQRYLVELKDTRSRRWPAPGEGVPQDVEAQVRWQMGVTGMPVADVAALRWSQLDVTTIEHDPALFEQLVVIAEDFRRRLVEGGPFAEDAASIKTRYPADDGSEMEADEQIEALVHDLLEWKESAGESEKQIELIETELKTRMATAQRLTGSGWSITWKRSKDKETTDWKNLADGLLRQLSPDERDALISLNTMTTPGARPFRLTRNKEQTQ